MLYNLFMELSHQDVQNAGLQRIVESRNIKTCMDSEIL